MIMASKTNAVRLVEQAGISVQEAFYEYDEKEHALTVTDLLADVIIYPDGRLKVVDLDELAEALDRKIMTDEQISRALRQVNDLLSMVYRDKFDQLQAPLELLGL